VPASLTFWKILPHLAMLQRRGVLVPFIGSGMSFPACRFWQPFVVRLAVGLSVPVPDELRNSKKTEEFFSQVENLGIAIPKELRAAQNAKAGLLRVLDRPEVPLRNNALESDIREFVKRRKLSGGTRNDAGRRCRDTFASLKKTCRKLGVRFWDYLQDRVRGLGKIPRLADLIRQKARQSTASNRQAVPAN